MVIFFANPNNALLYHYFREIHQKYHKLASTYGWSPQKNRYHDLYNPWKIQNPFQKKPSRIPQDLGTISRYCCCDWSALVVDPQKKGGKGGGVSNITTKILLVGAWTIWKICKSQNGFIFPKVRDENFKNLDELPPPSLGGKCDFDNWRCLLPKKGRPWMYLETSLNDRRLMGPTSS